MNCLDYDDALTVVYDWVNKYQTLLLERGINIRICKNNGLRVELDFLACLANIIVDESAFAPYRYVSFEAVSILKGNGNLLYSWYDNAKTDSNTILID